MGRKRKEDQKKKVTPLKVRPVMRKQAGKITEPYSILERLLEEKAVFEHIRHCRVKLWWAKDWKVDADGIATGATVCKANEIDRNLVEENVGVKETPDVFIKLAEASWQFLKEKDKERLIFHELCHVHPAKDANGEQKKDAKDRWLWRIGRHPITTFPEEISEYGLEAVLGSSQAIQTAIDKAAAPLLAEAERNAKAAT